MFYLACSGREDNRLALLYGYLEVSGHPEIFGVGDTSFKVLDVFDAVVPVGVADPFGFLAELHVQRRESGIQTEAYAVVHFGEVLVEAVVLYHQVVGFAECKERAELERGVGVGVDKSVSDEDTVFLRDKYGFFGKNHTTYAVCGAGHCLTVVFADILVSVWTVYTSLIAVESEIEWRAVLDYRFIERRQHHKVFVAELGNRNHQKSMLLAGVAPYNR